MPPFWIGESHVITVNSLASPSVNVTLTQAAPLSLSTHLVVNIADLLQNGTCLPHWSADASPSTTPQLSKAMQPGKYWIIVADVGGGTPVSYTVVASHL